MAPPARGNVIVKMLSDGTRVFKLRFRVHGEREMEVLHERRDCKCGCGGGWAERSHGEAFDALVRRARERLYGAIEDSEKDDASVERTLEDLVDEWRDDGEAR